MKKGVTIIIPRGATKAQVIFIDGQGVVSEPQPVSRAPYAGVDLNMLQEALANEAGWPHGGGLLADKQPIDTQALVRQIKVCFDTLGGNAATLAAFVLASATRQRAFTSQAEARDWHARAVSLIQSLYGEAEEIEQRCL